MSEDEIELLAEVLGMDPGDDDWYEDRFPMENDSDWWATRLCSDGALEVWCPIVMSDVFTTEMQDGRWLDVHHTDFAERFNRGQGVYGQADHDHQRDVSGANAGSLRHASG